MSLKLLTVIILFLFVSCTVPVDNTKTNKYVDISAVRLTDAKTGNCLQVRWIAAGAMSSIGFIVVPPSECSKIRVSY